MLQIKRYRIESEMIKCKPKHDLYHKKWIVSKI
jgi:hypothetical protein